MVAFFKYSSPDHMSQITPYRMTIIFLVSIIQFKASLQIFFQITPFSWLPLILQSFCIIICMMSSGSIFQKYFCKSDVANHLLLPGNHFSCLDNSILDSFAHILPNHLHLTVYFCSSILVNSLFLQITNKFKGLLSKVFVYTSTTPWLSIFIFNMSVIKGKVQRAMIEYSLFVFYLLGYVTS